MTITSTTTRLGTSESTMLDLVRTVAAIVVAYGHLSQTMFNSGWKERMSFAREAVVVFFVLSGFVIRYATTHNPATLGRYLADRASRMYSVVLPALLLTYLVYLVASRANPTFYTFWAADSTHPIERLLINGVFLGNIWSHRIALLSNIPYWSITCEVAYYVLYGGYFYLRGASRSIWLIFAAALYGPRILYLAPLWIAGCVLFDIDQRWLRGPGAFARTAFLTLLGVASYLGVNALQHSDLNVFHTSVGERFLTIADRNYIFPHDYALALLWIPVFLWLLQLARRISVRQDSRLRHWSQFIAEGSFPLYLFHTPLFVLAFALFPRLARNTPMLLGLLLLVIALSVLAGHPANMFKRAIRRWLLTSGGVVKRAFWPSLNRWRPS